MKQAILLLSFSLVSLFAVSVAAGAQEASRGVGIYPGDPKAYNGAVLASDPATYRNLALHRPAYASSSYDYNLTAQLVTDGIRETRLPRWVSTASSVSGTLARKDREHPIDDNPITSVDLPGTGGWIQIEPGGRDTPLEVDRVDVNARAWSRAPQAPWTCVIVGSDDGTIWTELGRSTGADVPPSPAWMQSRQIKTSILFSSAARRRFYRLQIDSPNVGRWQVGDVSLYDQGKHIEVGGPYDFTSVWKSAGAGEEWLYVDLGADCTFDRVTLYWVERAAEGAIEVSNDAATWRTVHTISSSGNLTEDLKLSQPEHARYVRVHMTRAAGADGYVLSELEIYGRGGPVPHPQPALLAKGGSRMNLARDEWRLQRDSLVTVDGPGISQPGFQTNDWLPATVPGTVLTSYLDDGAIPDPNYGRNQLQISDSFFYADFWYRDEFSVPKLKPGEHVWLNFDGINWKADIFFNGQKLGRIEGGFMRGKFDVTSLLRPGERNALAVRIIKNASAGSVKEKTLAETDSNGGALGADNPTAHASIGWDWIPTIRGRNTGIWGDVYLTTSGPVTIEEPFVSTTLPLPDISRADVNVEVTLRNHEQKEMTGTLRGEFGAIRFEKQVTVPAATDMVVKLDPSTTPVLRLQNPKLWWPAGYGDPNLYDVKLAFETGHHKVSDTRSFRAGVRQFTYTHDGEALKIFINGRRFIARGGNWGFPESMLRYRAREFDAAARYHKEMNFTMIRNWVGQTGDEAFFEACDKYGIVVWQDFWLANPYDGPDPNDNDLFMKNATDFVERIRNHPSIGLFCGRNEGDPPKTLEDGLTDLIDRLDPGMQYFPASSYGPVSGGGPYRAMPAKFYFEQRPTPKLHSELGMPNIVTMDSLRQMMPATDLWPQNDDWGMHDFTLNGAQNLGAYSKMIEDSYGPADNAADWVELAQFENYDGYRAMFEAQSKNRMGLLLWMSHPTWPDFVWQTYDYYFEPTAAYFASKKASEPLHIQWNPLNDNVEVVNYSAGNLTGLTAHIELFNMDGSKQWEKTATLDSTEDSVQSPIKIEYPANLSSVHFLRLKLTRSSETLSENFYWRGNDEGNFRALRELPKTKLSVATHVERKGNEWLLTTELNNSSSTPSLMVRVKAVREKSGDRILPAIYSDNYLALMPGEKRIIQTELEDADARGERPNIVVEGFNLDSTAAK